MMNFKKYISFLLLSIQIVQPISVFAGYVLEVPEDTYEAKRFNDTYEKNIPNPIGSNRLTAVLVDKRLYDKYERVGGRIDTYIKDIAKVATTPVKVLIPEEEYDVFQIYEGLEHMYFAGVGDAIDINNDFGIWDGRDAYGGNKLETLVVIGNIPLPTVEKNGRIWPTIQPWTDFIDPVYTYNEDRKRFENSANGDFISEIQHGIIRYDFPFIAYDLTLYDMDYEPKQILRIQNESEYNYIIEEINFADDIEYRLSKEEKREKRDIQAMFKSLEIGIGETILEDRDDIKAFFDVLEELYLVDYFDALHRYYMYNGEVRPGEDPDRLMAFFDPEYDESMSTDPDSIKRIFYEDTKRIEEGLSRDAITRYDNYAKNLEDMVYNWYSKRSIAAYLEEIWATQAIPWERMPEDMIAGLGFIEYPDGTLELPRDYNTPDIMKSPMPHLRNQIKNIFLPYNEAYKDVIEAENSMFLETGRWSGEEARSTITMIAELDLLHSLAFKRFNDRYERVLGQNMLYLNNGRMMSFREYQFGDIQPMITETDTAPIKVIEEDIHPLLCGGEGTPQLADYSPTKYITPKREPDDKPLYSMEYDERLLANWSNEACPELDINLDFTFDKPTSGDESDITQDIEDVNFDCTGTDIYTLQALELPGVYGDVANVLEQDTAILSTGAYGCHALYTASKLDEQTLYRYLPDVYHEGKLINMPDLESLEPDEKRYRIPTLQFHQEPNGATEKNYIEDTSTSSNVIAPVTNPRGVSLYTNSGEAVYIPFFNIFDYTDYKPFLPYFIEDYRRQYKAWYEGQQALPESDRDLTFDISTDYDRSSDEIKDVLKGDIPTIYETNVKRFRVFYNAIQDAANAYYSDEPVLIDASLQRIIDILTTPFKPEYLYKTDAPLVFKPFEIALHYIWVRDNYPYSIGADSDVQVLFTPSNSIVEDAFKAFMTFYRDAKKALKTTNTIILRDSSQLDNLTSDELRYYLGKYIEAAVYAKNDEIRAIFEASNKEVLRQIDIAMRTQYPAHKALLPSPTGYIPALLNGGTELFDSNDTVIDISYYVPNPNPTINADGTIDTSYLVDISEYTKEMFVAMLFASNVYDVEAPEWAQILFSQIPTDKKLDYLQQHLAHNYDEIDGSVYAFPMFEPYKLSPEDIDTKYINALDIFQLQAVNPYQCNYTSMPTILSEEQAMEYRNMSIEQQNEYMQYGDHYLENAILHMKWTEECNWFPINSDTNIRKKNVVERYFEVERIPDMIERLLPGDIINENYIPEDGTEYDILADGILWMEKDLWAKHRYAFDIASMNLTKFKYKEDLEKVILEDIPLEDKLRMYRTYKKATDTLMDKNFRGYEVAHIRGGNHDIDDTTGLDFTPEHHDRKLITGDTAYQKARAKDLGWKYMTAKITGTRYDDRGFRDIFMGSKEIENTMNMLCPELINMDTELVIDDTKDVQEQVSEYENTQNTLIDCKQRAIDIVHNTQKTVYKDTDSSTNKTYYTSPFDNITPQNTIDSIYTEQAQYAIYPSSNSSFDIEIEAHNSDGELINSIYDIPVEVDMIGDILPNMLRIESTEELIMRAGKSTLTLTMSDDMSDDMSDVVAGIYEIELKIGNITKRIAIEIMPYGIEITTDKRNIEAGNSDGSTLKVRAVRYDNTTDTTINKVYNVSTSDGYIANGSNITLENGVAYMTYMPSTKAQEVSIKLMDSDKTLINAESYINIIPLEPVLLDIKNAVPRLFPRNKPYEIEVQVVDKYGNPTAINSNIKPTFTLTGEGLTLINSDNNGVLEVQAGSNNTAKVQFIVHKDTTNAAINVISDSYKEGKRYNFTIEHNPYLSYTVDRASEIVGEESPIQVDFEAYFTDGTLMTDDLLDEEVVFEIVSQDFSRGLLLQKTVEVKDGKGHFEFYAGNRNGLVYFYLIKEGIPYQPFVFEIRSGPARKAEFTVDELDVRQGDKKTVALQMYDRFGNETNDYGHILIHPFGDIVIGEQGQDIPDDFFIKDDPENAKKVQSLVDVQPKIIVRGQDEDKGGKQGKYNDREIYYLGVCKAWNKPGSTSIASLYPGDVSGEKTFTVEDIMKDIDVRKRGRIYYFEFDFKKALEPDPETDVPKIGNAAVWAEVLPDKDDTKYQKGEDYEVAPATLDFQIKPLASNDGSREFHDKSPLALYTVLTGMQGYDGLGAHDYAQRMLFRRRTLGVSTAIESLDPRYHYGFLGKDGNIGYTMKPDFQYAGEARLDMYDEPIIFAKVFFGDDFILLKDKKELERIRDLFPKHTIFLATPGKEHKMSTDNTTVLYEGIPILQWEYNEDPRKINYTLHPLSNDIEIKTTPANSLDRWYVEYEGMRILEIYTPIPRCAFFAQKMQTDSNFEMTYGGSYVDDTICYTYKNPHLKAQEEGMLGFPDQHIEEGDSKGLGYVTEWKPITHFAVSKVNTAGEASREGTSDMHIFLGDPHAPILATENKREPDFQISPDLGVKVWESRYGNIQKIVPTKMNGGRYDDFWLLIGGDVYLLYKSGPTRYDYQEVGPIVRGVVDVWAIDIDQDDYSEMLISTNKSSSEGGFTLSANDNKEDQQKSYYIYDNVDGALSPPHLLRIEISEGIDTSLQIGNFNEDEISDILIIDNGVIKVLFGKEGGGYYSPQVVDILDIKGEFVVEIISNDGAPDTIKIVIFNNEGKYSTNFDEYQYVYTKPEGGILGGPKISYIKSDAVNYSQNMDSSGNTMQDILEDYVLNHPQVQDPIRFFSDDEDKDSIPNSHDVLPLMNDNGGGNTQFTASDPNIPYVPLSALYFDNYYNPDGDIRNNEMISEESPLEGGGDVVVAPGVDATPYEIDTVVEFMKGDLAGYEGASEAFDFTLNQLDNEPGACPQLPIESMPLFAPGNRTQDVNGISIPAEPQMGSPVFYFPPPTMMNSSFRLYVMPTTSLQIAVGLCTGAYWGFSNPIYNPNCFIFKIPLDLSGICELFADPDLGAALLLNELLKGNIPQDQSKPVSYHPGATCKQCNTMDPLQLPDTISKSLDAFAVSFQKLTMPSIIVEGQMAGSKESEKEKLGERPLLDKATIHENGKGEGLRYNLSYPTYSEEGRDRLTEDYNNRYKKEAYDARNNAKERMKRYEEGISILETQINNSPYKEQLMPTLNIFKDNYKEYKEGYDRYVEVLDDIENNYQRAQKNYDDMDLLAKTLNKQEKDTEPNMRKIKDELDTLNSYAESVRSIVEVAANSAITATSASQQLVEKGTALQDTFTDAATNYKRAPVDYDSLMIFLANKLVGGISASISSSAGAGATMSDISGASIQEFTIPNMNYVYYDPVIVDIPKLPEVQEFKVPEVPHINDLVVIESIKDEKQLYETEAKLMNTAFAEGENLLIVRDIKLSKPMQVNNMVFPELPKIPKSVFKNVYDGLNFDMGLETTKPNDIEEKNKIKTLASSFQDNMEPARVFLEMIGLLGTGILPVPEWLGYSHTVMLTNREALLPKDKIRIDQKTANADPSSGLAFKSSTFAFGDLANTLSSRVMNQKNMLACSIEAMNSAVGGGESIICNDEISSTSLPKDIPGSIKVSMQYTPLDLSKGIPNEYKDEYYDTVDMLLKRKERDVFKEYVKNEVSKTNKEYAALVGRDRNPDYVTTYMSNIHNKVAATEYYGTGIPDDGTINDGLIKPEQPLKAGLYFIDKSERDGKMKAQIVANYTMPKYIPHVFFDIDNDGKKEIPFALGADLYVEHRKPRMLRGRAGDKSYELPYKDYKELFSIGKDIRSFSDSEGGGMTFTRYMKSPKPLKYYEWTVIDRQDREWGEGKHINNDDIIGKKRSFVRYDRHALITADPLRYYEIRPLTVTITDIKGDPTLFTSPQIPIPKMPDEDVSSCTNPKYDTYNVPNNAILVGQEDDSYMLIMVPERENVPDEEIYDVIEMRINAGEETKVPSGKVCLLRGSVDHVLAGELVETPIRPNLYLEDKTRLELYKNDKVQLYIRNSGNIDVNAWETYTMHRFDSDLETLDVYSKIPINGLYSGVLWAMDNSFDDVNDKNNTKDDRESYVYPRLYHPSETRQDIAPPIIKLSKGNKYNAVKGSKIEIDARNTVDTNGINTVWYDLNDDIDSDNNGDRFDDNDFPGIDNMHMYTPEELLYTTLPIEDSVGEHSYSVVVEDTLGNIGYEKITVNIIKPELRVVESSVREGTIKVQIIPNIADIPITLERDRSGIRTQIMPKIVPTDDNGYAVFDNLSTTKYIEIMDMSTKNVIMKMLENGKITFIDDDYRAIITPATESDTMILTLMNMNNTALITISLQPKTLPNTIITDMNTDDTYITDTVNTLSKEYYNATMLYNIATDELIGTVSISGEVFMYNDNYTLEALKNDDMNGLYMIIYDRDGNSLYSVYTEIEDMVYVDNG